MVSRYGEAPSYTFLRDAPMPSVAQSSEDVNPLDKNNSRRDALPEDVEYMIPVTDLYDAVWNGVNRKMAVPLVLFFIRILTECGLFYSPSVLTVSEANTSYRRRRYII